MAPTTTSPTSARSRRDVRRRRRRPGRGGFTLVELLVVITIILILIGIAIPMAMIAYRSSVETRVAADLQTIGLALEAFKSEHGDYPRVETPGTGFAVLTRALYGPYGDGVVDPSASPLVADPVDPPPYSATEIYNPGDVVRDGPDPDDLTYVALRPSTGEAPSTVPTTFWAPFSVNDRHDGLGFKTRDDGKPIGPYLQEGKFTLRGLAILDTYRNPILYFPARPAKPNIALVSTGPNGAYLPNMKATAPTFTAPPVKNNTALYDPSDNWLFFWRATDPSPDSTTLPVPALRRIHAMLGDLNMDGAINDVLVDETALADQPYLLWSAGRDGQFGPIDETAPQVITNGDVAADAEVNRELATNADDITNFRQ